MNKEDDCIIKLIVYSRCKNVGVSSLILRYTNDIFIQDHPSLEPDIFKTKVVLNENDVSIKVQIFDCGFKDFKTNYLKGVHGYLLVYDISNKNSLECIIDEINDINQYGHSRAKDCILIVGNKSDLNNEERIVTLDSAKLYFESNNLINYFNGETSCKYSNNVIESFQKLIQKTFNILYNNLSNNKNNDYKTINNNNNNKCNIL